MRETFLSHVRKNQVHRFGLTLWLVRKALLVRLVYCFYCFHVNAAGVLAQVSAALASTTKRKQSYDLDSFYRNDGAVTPRCVACEISLSTSQSN